MGKIQLNRVSGLNYSLRISASNAVIVSCIWNNGHSGSSISVTGNQEYSCQVNYNIEGRSETAVLRYDVKDYDTSGPNVMVNYDDSTWESSKIISIIATDTGVGLHNTAYRYYNGIAWSEWSGNASYRINENGTYQVEVRDALGNITKKEIVIKTIISNISNVSKQDKVEENKVSKVETIPSKGNIQKEEKNKVDIATDKKDEIIVESSTIDVKEAMSEPEKEEIVYHTLTVPEESMIIIEEKDDSVEAAYLQRPYEEITEINKTYSNEYSQMACAMGVVGVPFLFFWSMGNTRIYSVNEHGKQKFLCRAFLTKKGKLKISRFYLKKNKSNTILIKPSKTILEKKHGKVMCIRIGERNFSKQIQEEILLEY